MRASFAFLILVLASMSLTACKVPLSSTRDDSLSYSGPMSALGESAMYSQANAVFRNNCVSCHAEFGTYTEAQWQSAGYVVPGRPNQSLIFQMIKGSGAGGGNMPLGGQLSFTDIFTIESWIAQVTPFQTNTGTLSAAQRTSAALQVIQSSCASCHSDANHLQTVTPTGHLGPISASGAGLGSAIGAFSEGDPASANSFGNAQVAEALLFQQAINSADRLTVECYLANKFALTVSENCASLSQTPLPTQVSGLQLWLKNESLSALGLQNGTAINMWVDSSGNGYDHRGEGSTPRNLPTLVAGALNNLPAVNLGTGYLDNTSLIIVGESALTAIMVYKSLSPNAVSEQDVWTFGFQQTRLFGFGVTGGLFDYFVKGSVGPSGPDGGSTATSVADGRWHIHTSTYSASGGLNAFVDGPSNPTISLHAGLHSGQSVPAFGAFTTDAQFVQSGLAVAQQPSSSWLFQALLNYGSIGVMPQGGPALTTSQAQTLSNWITQMGNP